MSDPGRYGNCYWCAKVDRLSENGEIYVFADDAVVNEHGDLLFVREKDDRRETVLAIAAGQWRAFFAASCLDGCAVAVEHWQGEVER